MSLTNEDREALDRLHLTGWHLVAEHDPGCPGDERYCMSHCPVPVQHPATNDEINAAVEQIVARRVAEARAAALNEAADDFRENAARVWGYDAAWLTTGRKVANLAADWLAREADDLSPPP